MPAIGHYQVVRELARGGMGAVFHARSPEGRDVALKIILNPGARDAITRFERERRLLAQLGEAEGFVPILDAGDDRSGPFLVMPLVTGGTLRDRLENGPLPVEQAVVFMGKVARAVGKAHALGIVHRDLKPENILFTAEGEPLVADLGLAKHFRRDVDGGSQSIALSKTGEFKGTLGYMAPEQTGQARDVGPEADVFSLGAILYECVAGQAPFEGRSPSEVIAKVASGSIPDVRTLRADAPRWVSRVAVRALRREPKKRYPDATALARALEEGPVEDRRYRIRLALAAVLPLGIAAAALALSGRGRDERAPATGGAAAASTTSKSVAPTPASGPARSGPPAWYRALPERERPRLPLPRGLAFGADPGVYRNEKDESELVYVSGGPFRMGTDDDEVARAHDVVLSPFFIGRYEVTLEQFERFVAATDYKTFADQGDLGAITFAFDSNAINRAVAATFRAPDGQEPAKPRDPVAQLSWDDVQAYCVWAGLVLPTEAQWEYAAGWDPRAKEHRRFPWGNIRIEDDYPTSGKRRANVLDETFMKTFPVNGLSLFHGYDDGFVGAAPVGSFPDGISPAGCHDMCGNVREWVRDAWDPTISKSSPRDDPCREALEGDAAAVSIHVVRGGSFATSTTFAPTWNRGSAVTTFHAWDLGFRVARAGR
jgi:formylglycine-generating enzyme required for sulfatase activity